MANLCPLKLITLKPLMELTKGNPKIIVGLIDGPVAMDHPELETRALHKSCEQFSGSCISNNSASCRHGTFVAGILFARRGSAAPAICPGCSVIIKPIFAEETLTSVHKPTTTPAHLAQAIFDCINTGAKVINMSLALTESSTTNERELEELLNIAARREIIVVAATGNQGTIGSNVITRHPWVIPVAACDLQGRPTNRSNFGLSIGRRGLLAPGEKITSLHSSGGFGVYNGTSVAAPFVTGTIALLWSVFPQAPATQIKIALTKSYASHRATRATVVPTLLDASAAYKYLSNITF